MGRYLIKMDQKVTEALKQNDQLSELLSYASGILARAEDGGTMTDIVMDSNFYKGTGIFNWLRRVHPQ